MISLEISKKMSFWAMFPLAIYLVNRFNWTNGFYLISSLLTKIKYYETFTFRCSEHLLIDSVAAQLLCHGDKGMGTPWVLYLRSKMGGDSPHRQKSGGKIIPPSWKKWGEIIPPPIVKKVGENFPPHHSEILFLKQILSCFSILMTVLMKSRCFWSDFECFYDSIRKEISFLVNKMWRKFPTHI